MDFCRPLIAKLRSALHLSSCFSIIYMSVCLTPVQAEKLPFNGKTIAAAKSIVTITPMQYADAMFKKKVNLTIEQTSKLKIDSGYRISKLNIITLDKAMQSQISDIRNSAIVLDLNTLEVPHQLLGPYYPAPAHWKEQAIPSSWQYLKKDGKALSADKYAYAFDFDKNKAIVDLSKSRTKDSCDLKIIGTDGKDLSSSVPELKSFCKKYVLWGNFHEDLAPVLDTKTKRFHFINPKFKLAFGPSFDDVCTAESGFYEKVTPVKDDEFWGFIDVKGNPIVKPRFADARQFHDGMAAVKIFGFEAKQTHRTSPQAAWTYVDRKGKRLRMVYDEVSNFSHGAAAVTTLPFKGRPRKQLMDAKEHPLGRAYDQIGVARDGLIPVVQDGHAGFVDAQGKVVIEPKYRAVAPFSEGLAAVAVAVGNGDGLGFIDKAGKLVIPAKFALPDGYFALLPADSYKFVEGMAVMPQNGKFGYIDRKGNWVIPPIYDNARSFSCGLAAVQKK